jgi:hypothetical protein
MPMSLCGWTADGTFGANRLEGLALKEVPIPTFVGVIGNMDCCPSRTSISTAVIWRI